MNFIEWHIGDYLRDTAHLSMLEDAAYRRLLDRYYTSEQPLPADVRACCKLARASTAAERAAVAAVLREFFILGPDGYRQTRADAEIARYQDKQRKARASAEARWSQTERNANAYANAPPNAMRPHMRSDMQTQSERNADGMHRAPVPSPQSPDTNTKDQRAHTREVCACALAEVRKSFPQADESADLVALVEQGATPAEIGAIAAEAVTKGKGWPWVVTTVIGRRQDAAKLTLAPKPQPPWHETRSGIVAKGVELGVGEWSEAEWHAGRAPQWPTYQAKVYAAAGYEPPRMSA